MRVLLVQQLLGLSLSWELDKGSWLFIGVADLKKNKVKNVLSGYTSILPPGIPRPINHFYGFLRVRASGCLSDLVVHYENHGHF